LLIFVLTTDLHMGFTNVLTNHFPLRHYYYHFNITIIIMFKPAGNQIKRRMTAGFKQKNLFRNLNLQACHFTFSGAVILAHPKGVGYLLLLDCGPRSSSKCCMCEWQPGQHMNSPPI
jgi:hypothetical protein